MRLRKLHRASGSQNPPPFWGFFYAQSYPHVDVDCLQIFCSQLRNRCFTKLPVDRADLRLSLIHIFRDLFPAATGLAARDGERLAAMCFALPQQLSCGDTVLSAAYLYAVATDEGYRGQGLCRALLAFAEKELKKRGADAVLLVPADEGLAAMYAVSYTHLIHR